jgi:hypothetical protein
MTLAALTAAVETCTVAEVAAWRALRERRGTAADVRAAMAQRRSAEDALIAALRAL